jgi:DNA-binding NarL/FixJ family response regulator
MKDATPISVLITDDHALMRECWSIVLNENKDFQVIGQCCNAVDAIEKARELRPQVIVMDINLPDIDGIEATRTIKSFLPDVKILGVSMHVQRSYAAQIIKAGALGYITKNSTVSEMFEALHHVSHGKKYICREIVDLISQSFINDEDQGNLLNTLTKRESHIVSLIYKGYTSKQIAESLFMSIRTVSAHRYNIFQKLNIKKAVSLVNLLNQNTWSH